MYVNIRCLFFSSWLTSLSMTVSRSIHISTNEFQVVPRFVLISLYCPEKAKVLFALLYLTLPPRGLEFSRKEDEWVAIPSSAGGGGWGAGLPNPGIDPGSTCIAGRFFTIWATREMLISPEPSAKPIPQDNLVSPLLWRGGRCLSLFGRCWELPAWCRRLDSPSALVCPPKLGGLDSTLDTQHLGCAASVSLVILVIRSYMGQKTCAITSMQSLILTISSGHLTYS